MSCAVFEIPKSQKVTIMGGSETTGWLTDNAGCDDHYSFRTIRTTVAARSWSISRQPLPIGPNGNNIPPEDGLVRLILEQEHNLGERC